MTNAKPFLSPKIGENVSLTFSVFIVVVVITLTLVITVLGYFSVNRAMLQNDRDLVKLEIQTIEKLLGNYIRHHAQVLKDYAESPIIINSSMNDMSNDQDRAMLDDVLREFKLVGKPADFILLDINGDVVGQSGRGVVQREVGGVFDDVINGHVSYFFEFKERENNDLVMTFTAPVMYYDNPEGVLVAEVAVSLESIIFDDARVQDFEMLVYQGEKAMVSMLEGGFEDFWEESFKLPNSEATMLFRIDSTRHRDYLNLLGLKVLLLAISIMAVALAVFRFVGQKLFVEPSQIVLLAQKETALANSRLLKVNEDLSQFAYIASHDLKSPLLAVTQLAGWIKEDCEDLLPDGAKKYLKLMQERIARMQKLLDDLLEYSRVGRYEYEFEDIDLKSMAKSVFSLHDKSEGFTFEVLGECQGWSMPAVPVELVLRNLFSNAIKHHDKMVGSIKVICDSKDGYYMICVQDDGPGIDKTLHKKAFEMFQTLKPRDEVEGSGMGLALIKKVVESYDGKVEIESAVGEGTTITTYWPIPRD